LIHWIDTIREKHPGRFKSTTAIQAAASYDRATKREEVLIDIYGTKDINAMERLLEAWHGEKRKGLKVKVTATLSELPQISNTSSNLQASTPDSSIQGLSNQIGSLLEAITGQNKKGKALGSTATALQRLNMPSTLLTEVLT